MQIKMLVRFKYTIVCDKRRKLQSGKYPIKVNIHSYADNKNHYVSIRPLFTASGKLEFSCENKKEFDSVSNSYRYYYYFISRRAIKKVNFIETIYDPT